MEPWHIGATLVSLGFVIVGAYIGARYELPNRKLPLRVVAYTATAWVTAIPLFWGVVGRLAGEPFWSSALIPGEVIFRSLPYLLKAL